MKFQSAKKDRLSLRVSLYHEGFGLVTETRHFASEEEIDEIQFNDIAETAEADSIMLKGAHVLEQNFDFGVGDQERLLSKYIGQNVMLRSKEQGGIIKMRLLNASDGIIGECLETGEILLNPSGDLVLPPLPKNAAAKPTLSLKVAPGKPGGDIQLSYLAQGLQWNASYVVEVQGETIRIIGRATIRNQTGMDFHQAELKLIAGEVKRMLSHQQLPIADSFMQNSLRTGTSIDGHAFSDYHVYRLGQMDLPDGQTKQVNFLTAESVKFKRIYAVERTSRQATLKLQFANTAANGMGMPLPLGAVKMYSFDADNELEFLGEDGITLTPRDEQVSLVMGEAFGIQADSEETLREYQDGYEYVTFVYRLTNRKEENVRIDIHHRFYELHWKMQSSSHDYEVKNAEAIEFKVRLGVGKEAVVEFTYQVDLKRG